MLASKAIISSSNPAKKKCMPNVLSGKVLTKKSWILLWFYWNVSQFYVKLGSTWIPPTVREAEKPVFLKKEKKAIDCLVGPIDNKHGKMCPVNPPLINNPSELECCIRQTSDFSIIW